jgi:hypothetical protein
MTTWQKPTREPPKTKAQLREMLTEAVRNTQPEPKRPPKAKQDRGYGRGRQRGLDVRSIDEATTT